MRAAAKPIRSTAFFFILTSLAALLIGWIFISIPAQANTFTVNDTGDGGDANTADTTCADAGGNCTLRAAIEQANAQATGAPHTIQFSIPSSDPGCTASLCTIQPAAALPAITRNGTTIDATTQSTNQPANCSPSPKCIVLDGSAAPAGTHGLTIGDGTNAITSVTIKGFVIIKFASASPNGTEDGILIQSQATGNTVRDNFIGVDQTGNTGAGNGNSGVHDFGGNNTIGPNNVIGGNGGNGVRLEAKGTTVKGNKIGTNATGTSAIANNFGVRVNGNSNIIGGTGASDGNLISGNSNDGISGNTGVTDVSVLGNIIGLNMTGDAPLGNSADGIDINGTGWCIGGLISVGVCGNGGIKGNVISGNTIGVDTANAATIIANIIGLGSGGTACASCGNSAEGIRSTANGSTVQIGGTTSARRNFISDNGSDGVLVSDGKAIIEGNYLGLDTTGAAAGNTGNGVNITTDETGNVIGHTSNAAGGNAIGSNGANGVKINGTTGTNANTVANNIIGLDPTGTATRANLQNGLDIDPSNNNTIGPGNVISGNINDGVKIDGKSNKVIGNIIGLNSSGTADLGNAGHGVALVNDSDDNEIGGSTLSDRNVISGNGGDGVNIGDGSDRNEVLGNIIGLGSDGSTVLGNDGDGVQIADSTGGANCVGGRDADNAGAGVCAPVAGAGPNGGAGNTISGNKKNGIEISGSTGSDAIFGNFIGLDQGGTLDKGNTLNGILFSGGAGGYIVGGDTTVTSRFRNVISGNDQNGIKLNDSGGGGDKIQGNYIGTDKNGTSALPNSFDGINIDPSNNNTIGGDIGANPGIRNVISGNTGNGITIDGSTGTKVQGNFIGTKANGSCGSVGNGQDGVHIQNGAQDNIVGAPLGTNGSAAVGLRNSIACNTDDGVEVDGATTIRNFIHVNSITTNGDKGIQLSNGANGGILPPTVTGSNPFSGSACVSCDVDAYTDSDGEGAIYLNTGTANTACGLTSCTFLVSGVIGGPNSTATASHAGQGTSEFSTPFNSLPVVDAKDNKTLHAGLSVTQTGSFIDLDAGQNHTILWQVLVAGNTANCAIPGPTNQLKVTVSTVLAGSCTVRLTVTDDGNPAQSASDTFFITTTNNPPFFASPVNQTGSPGQSFTLDSGAKDPDVDSLTYSWTLPSGAGTAGCALPGPNTNSTVLIITDPTKEGTCDVKIDVTDGHLFPAGTFVSTQITVTTINHTPVANAGPDQSVHAGKPVTIQGAGTDLDPGQTLTFAWTLPSGAGTAGCSFGGTTNTSKVTVNTTTTGTCTVRLTVTDNGAGNKTSTDDMLITTTNNPPFFASPVNQTVVAGKSVTLSANAQDPDGDTLTFVWSLVGGAGTAGCSLPNPTNNGTVLVQTSTVGTCTVRVDVNDGHGGMATTQVTITAINNAPFFTNLSTVNVLVGQSITINPGATDPDGDLLTFVWSLVGGAGTASCSLVGSTTSPTVLVQTTTVGTCAVKVDANDSHGGTASAQIGVSAATSLSGGGNTAVCNVPATPSVNQIKFIKNWAKYIKITVTNAANSTGTATLNAIVAVAGKNLSVDSVKMGKTRLLPPFNVNLPPKSQQTFTIRLRSSVTQTVNAPFVEVSGLCNSFSFNVPVNSALHFIPAVRWNVEQLGVRVQMDQIVAIVQGLSVQNLQLQIFDTNGHAVIDQTIKGNSLALPTIAKNGQRLANGVYLAIVTVLGNDGKVVRSEVKKLLIVH